MHTHVNWQKAADPVLKKGMVHVWMARYSAAELAGLDKFLLSDHEQARASRYRLDHVRDRFVFSHSILRRILGHYLQLAPRAISFQQTDSGKPVLALEMNSSIHFSLSHARDLSLYAFALDFEIGIDVEYLQRKVAVDAIARRYFAPSEQDVLVRTSPDQRRGTFFRYWTCKEALLKASGKGLAGGLQRVVIGLHSFENPSVSFENSDPDAVVSWQLQQFIPRPQYLAALAIPAMDYSTAFFSWQTERE